VILPTSDTIINERRIDVELPGQYQLRLVNQNGCVSERDFLVNIDTLSPSVSITFDSLSCEQNEVSVNAFSADALVYEWTGPDNFSNSQASFITDNAGEYSLTAMAENGCLTSRTILIPIDTLQPVVNLDDVDLNCNESQFFELDDVRNEWLYEWTLPNGEVISATEFNINISGEYVLSVNNTINGCSTQASFKVSIPQRPMIADLSVQQPNCLIDARITSISIENGTPPYVFEFGQMEYDQLDEIRIEDFGMFDLMVVDNNLCRDTASFVINDFIPVAVTLESPINITALDTYALMPVFTPNEGVIDSISWFPSGFLSCEGCLNPNIAGAFDGQLTIWVRDTNFCTDQASTVINLIQDDFFVPNVISPNDDGINDLFRVYSSDASQAVIEELIIFNRWGGKVFERYSFSITSTDQWWDGTFKGEKLNDEVFAYLIKIRDSSGRQRTLHGDVTLLR
jgi:gliding motility-associated-like protein